ncbi:thermonuclease family protein [Actinomycetospora chibensis]|uniref:Thermonuclease family protein n=1 Tax=Actinomycetospora chibensis TaxID=663606 RepID=A0ABV9RNP2_9PSEU|nr:thermonuclease family protein [Actinomycetospora chibensis]MDD7926973.1 thermonuclease family protein [Actinomycetospora chibensis]
MPYALIKGQSRIVGTAPDGDSFRFYPDDEDAFDKAGLRVRVNAGGGAQLRLEGIDTPETHYTPPVGGTGPLHQPPPSAKGAASRALELLGFTRVERRPGETVTESEPETVPCHIATRSTDDYGRCIAFAFSDETAQDDPAFFLTGEKVRESINHHLVDEGWAYVTFYSSLFADLRGTLADAASKAQAAKHGVWRDDATLTGLTLTSIDTITEERLVLPKLFRRLVDYLAVNDGNPDLSGFLAYVDTHGGRVIRTDTTAVTGFDNVLHVHGQTVKLVLHPSELIFLE